jgi:hypothetical protein
MVDDPVRDTFPDLNLDTFWDENEYALSSYVDTPASPALIASVEAQLGYRYSWPAHVPAKATMP